MKKSKNLESRSPEVQEIIGQIPHWLIRWGLTAILSVLIILVFITWFIKYPDVANVSVEIIETQDRSQAIAQGLAEERYFSYIKVGQAAKINLAAYPFNEHGAVKGSVVLKSGLNSKGQFMVTISLPNGLITTQNKILSYIPHMTGNAQIILRESKLINKIFGQFVKR